MRPISRNDFEMEAELLTLSFQDMYVKWGANQPPRTGLHASSLLVSEKEWCVRRHVLSEVFPDDSIQPESQPWDWKRSAIFENGWDLHKRWQRVLLKCGKVVYGEERTPKSYHKWAEIDHTHFDPERNLYFSPDAIIEFGSERYVVEIKGIRQEPFKDITITGDLETAMDLCETVEKAYYQCQLYMHLLEITKGILLIENKNNQDFKLWVIGYSFEAVKPLIERMYSVKRDLALYRQRQWLPAYICASRGDTLARQCPMRDKCFSVKEEE